MVLIFHVCLYCSSLKDIKPLEKWNVSNGTNFLGMFADCSSLDDIKSLEKWNVSNGTNFFGMFAGCSSLKDTKPLEKWNLKENDFKDMFRED